METIEIKKVNALLAHQEADSKTKKVLENLFKGVLFTDIRDIIKTMKDVFDYEGIDMAAFYEKCKINGDTEDEIGYKECKLIVKVLRQGWVPDYNNPNQKKWFPVFDRSSGVGFSYSVYDGWYTHTTVGSRLELPTAELAEFAGKNFNANYKKFLS